MAVDRQVGTFLTVVEDVNDAVVGDDDGAVGEHVRANGRDAETVDGREDDGAAGGKRIGSGTGGSGDDETVGLVGGDEVVVDVCVEIDHAGEFGFGDDDVIEGGIGADRFAVAPEFAIDHAAAADAMFAGDGAFQFGVEFFFANGGEEAEVAEVNGEDGDIVTGDSAGGGKKRAVTAENDEQFDAFGEFFAAEEFGIASILGGELVAAVAHAAFV